jgi:hypothetical protein
MRQSATAARPNARLGVSVKPAFAALFGVEV